MIYQNCLKNMKKISRKMEKEEGMQTAKKKKKKPSPLKRKPPKYDARKAIEDAKNNHEGETVVDTKKDDKNNFRQFIKGIKEDHEKHEKNVTKKIDVPHGGETTPGSGGGLTKIPLGSKLVEKKEEEEDGTRRRKVITTEINMRKKLHELEKSPPPRVSITNYNTNFNRST